MVPVNWSWREDFPQKATCQSFVVMVMGDCKAELSLQSLQGSLSDKLISHNMYECFMNTKYLCACLKKISCKLEP